MAKMILLVLAFVLFVLAAVGIGQSPPSRFNLLAGGLAAWVLSLLIG